MTSSPLNSDTSRAAFDRLHPLIQRKLYDMRWEQLRPIQVDAIHAVLDGQGHLIIEANTAAGKTEAAFLPILSCTLDHCHDGVRALYIGPLKALINDQFRRLEELCDRAEIPVHKWHGDVGVSDKRAMLKSPSGVLLITPESVESLFINRASFLESVFSSLTFIVIDEMHAFMGSERGAHLKSLLSRISQLSRTPPRMIGLSATLGDSEAARLWLWPRAASFVTLLRGTGERSIKYLIKGYLRNKPTADEPALETFDPSEKPDETDDDWRLASDIVNTFYRRPSLVFANSRATLEFYADLTRRLLEHKHLPNQFRVHHGSLSKAERESTETELRESRTTTVFCSSTLELGIDVGHIESVGQIDPPWSVSALSQRLGRSGRSDKKPSELVMFIEESGASHKQELIPRLFPGLLQSVAMTNLLLQKWCEPPETQRMHLSTLIQQILSVIAERGGASATTLFDVLVRRGAFVGVSSETFAAVLKGLGTHDLIEQIPEGDLILGITGERIVRSLDFYAAFESAREMSVYYNSHLIGSVAAPPGIGGDRFLILAGRRWKVVEIYPERQEILVEPAKGGRLPYFASKAGIDIHEKIRAEMHVALCSNDSHAYLDQQATAMLKEARAFACQMGITDQALFTDGSNTWWFTWTGSKTHRTLLAIWRHLSEHPVQDEDIALRFCETSVAEVRALYGKYLSSPADAVTLAEVFPVHATEKYDGYLPPDLQAQKFAHNNLDVASALALIRKIFT